jgi:putative methyltransferase (TIGR04325 family)
MIPPFLIDSAKQLLKPQWTGNHSSWAQAQALCSGYSSDIILQKLVHAQTEVLNERADYERDTVLFFKKEFNFFLVSSFFYAVRAGAIRVVDFGGALGSAYFQNRDAFGATKLSWAVVEQENVVQVGKEKFQNENLNFFHSLIEAKNSNQAQILFSSCTLPYLEQPYQILQEIIDSDFEFIILDRIGFNAGEGTRLTVQKVPRSIYSASYPCWFLNETKFLDMISEKYTLIWDCRNDDAADVPSYYKGFFFKRKETTA